MLGKFAPAGNVGLLKKFKNQFTDGGVDLILVIHRWGGQPYKIGF